MRSWTMDPGFLDPSSVGSDQVLYSDIRSCSTVDYYASNQGAFFGDFVAAMTKLGRIGVKNTGHRRRDTPGLSVPELVAS